jgi:hypothetical protein
MKLYQQPPQIHTANYKFDVKWLPLIVAALNVWTKRQTLDEGCILRIANDNGKREHWIRTTDAADVDDITHQPI